MHRPLSRRVAGAERSAALDFSARVAANVSATETLSDTAARMLPIGGVIRRWGSFHFRPEYRPQAVSSTGQRYIVEAIDNPRSVA